MNAFQSDSRSTPLAGRLGLVLRVGGLALVAGCLIIFAAGVSVRLRQLPTILGPQESSAFLGMPSSMEAIFTSRLGPAEAEALPSLGLSPGAYAAYLLSFEVGLALVCTLVGLFIFWQRSEGWLTVWMAVVLVLLGTASVAPEVPALASVWPGAWLFFTSAGILGMVSNLHLLFLAPDGRFVPRWTWWLAAGFTGGMLAFGLWTSVATLRWGLLAGLQGIFVVAPIWLVLIGVGIVSQVYRYQHISGPVERQQAKWVLVGLAAVTVGILINATLLISAGAVTGLARVWCNLARVTLVNLCLLALPICLAFSILRYRLWDIDLLIRRTLIYSMLTAALVLVYFSSVVLLQALVGILTGQRQLAVVTVLSTLALAAAFVPLRRRVQDFIDRRFYRRKYDAARTLASFAVAARDEVDLDRLSAQLVAVVDDTMQPERVSLWLRKGRS